jgi:hypothetical protein
MSLPKKEAIEKLIEMGATKETKEDFLGDTKSGWWMDASFLAKSSDPNLALEALLG